MPSTAAALRLCLLAVLAARTASQLAINAYAAEVPVLVGSAADYRIAGTLLETAFLHEGDDYGEVVLSLCARQQSVAWRKCASSLGGWFGDQAFARQLDFEAPRRYRRGAVRSSDPSTAALVRLAETYGANATVCHVGSAVGTATLFWLAATDDHDHDHHRGVRVIALEVGDGEFVTDLRSLFRLLFAHRAAEVLHLNHADAMRALPRLACDVVVVDADVLPVRLLDPADADKLSWTLDARSFSAAAVDALVGDGTGGLRPHTLLVGREPRGARLVADLVGAGSAAAAAAAAPTQSAAPGSGPPACVHIRHGHYDVIDCPDESVAGLGRAHPRGPLWQGRFVAAPDAPDAPDAPAPAPPQPESGSSGPAEPATVHLALVVCDGGGGDGPSDAAPRAGEALVAVSSAAAARDAAAVSGTAPTQGLAIHIVADAAARAALEPQLACVLGNGVACASALGDARRRLRDRGGGLPTHTVHWYRPPPTSPAAWGAQAASWP